MKIEVGDKVELNNGEVHEVEWMIGGPDYVTTEGYGPFVIGDMLYHEDGCFADCGYWHILSVKRILSRASDDTRIPQESEPKMWRDRTDWEKANVPDDVLNDPANPLRIPWNEWSRVAKGAVLLAENEGEVIEWYDFDFDGAWVDDKDFIEGLDVYDDLAYRIKPEPVRETVTLMIDDGGMGGPRPIGTIDLEDGEPNPASIKMEKV